MAGAFAYFVVQAVAGQITIAGMATAWTVIWLFPIRQRMAHTSFSALTKMAFALATLFRLCSALTAGVLATLMTTALAVLLRFAAALASRIALTVMATALAAFLGFATASAARITLTLMATALTAVCRLLTTIASGIFSAVWMANYRL